MRPGTAMPGRNGIKKVSIITIALLVFLPPFGCYDNGYYFGPYPSLNFLNPLYSEETLVYDPEMVGKWGDSDESMEFFPSGDKGGYTAVFTFGIEDDQVATLPFKAHLASLEGTRYLDLQLDEKALELDPKYADLFLPTHWIYRVEEVGENLILSSLDTETGRLRQYLMDHPDDLTFLPIGNLREPGMTLGEEVSDEESQAILVTAKTADLQKFITKHQDNEELDLWSNEDVLERVELEEVQSR